MSRAAPSLVVMSVLAGASGWLAFAGSARAQEPDLPQFNSNAYCKGVLANIAQPQPDDTRRCLAVENTARQLVLTDWKQATPAARTKCERDIRLLYGGSYEGLSSCLRAQRRDRDSRSSETIPTV